MAFDYSYRFTEKAETDLTEILRYITDDLCNPGAAKELGGKIFESIDTVRNFPLSGLPVENLFLADKTIRRLLVDNYIVYYKAADSEKTIYIIRIVYGKRNLDEIYREINVW